MTDDKTLAERAHTLRHRETEQQIDAIATRQIELAKALRVFAQDLESAGIKLTPGWDEALRELAEDPREVGR